MTEKLKFEPVEGNVIIEFNTKNSKITPSRKIDIALKILEECSREDRETFFVPVYNAMVEAQAKKVFKDDFKPLDPDPPETA